ncbi:MAG: hypothetical protein ACI841_002997 [Planctomycetota bacterium]|jgi:hypothetical protein
MVGLEYRSSCSEKEAGQVKIVQVQADGKR